MSLAPRSVRPPIIWTASRSSRLCSGEGDCGGRVSVAVVFEEDGECVHWGIGRRRERTGAVSTHKFFIRAIIGTRSGLSRLSEEGAIMATCNSTP
eukprot:2595968-Rhodomonas_salina.1